MYFYLNNILLKCGVHCRVSLQRDVIWQITLAVLLTVIAGCGGEGVPRQESKATPPQSVPEYDDAEKDYCAFDESYEVESVGFGGLDKTLEIEEVTEGSLLATGLVDSDSRYLYAPSLMYDENEELYKFWGCGGVSGDYIIYKSSSSMEGLADESWQFALAPADGDEAFDSTHVCDPSVVVAGNETYLYYGGLNEDDGLPFTRIGVAKSEDGGLTFNRLHDGEPIVQADSEMLGGYGIGQPAVTFNPDDGFYYMLYTDINCSEGVLGCQTRYIQVIRSSDPKFSIESQEHVKTLNPDIIKSYSLDLAYDRDKKSFVVVGNRNNADSVEVMLIYFDSEFNMLGREFYDESQRLFRFGEGIAILKSPDGTIINNNEESSVVFVGATYNDNAECVLPNHIAGPSRFVTFRSNSNNNGLTD